jgi:hypothetical protein
MNIQQYYKKYAEVSLNASLAACIPPFLFLNIWLLVDRKLPILVMTIPFMVYSFFSYQSYLIGKKRYMEVTESPEASNLAETFFETNHMLIAYLPAPSLRMLLFSPSGNLIGEVKDLRFWYWRWFLPYFMDKLFPHVYGLYNEKGELIARIQVGSEKDGLIKIYENDELLCLYLRKKSEIIFEDGKRLLCETRNGEMYFYDQEKKAVCEYKKGWMPLEWGKHFKDPNTPILSFHHLASKEEKLAVISFLVQQNRYRNH